MTSEAFNPIEFDIVDKVTQVCMQSHMSEDCDISVERICGYVRLYGGWFQMTDDYNTSWWFTLIMFLSISISLAFFMVIYWTKELQAHPMKLIMTIALSESAFQYLLIAQFYICETRANELFSYTVLWSWEEEDLIKSTLILVASSLYCAFFFLLFSLTLNTMLCLDLILMVRYPFERKEARLNKYRFCSVLLASPPAMLLSLKPFDISWLNIGASITIGYVSVYLMVFVTSVLYTWSKLRGPSFSSEVRYLVLKRHIITSTVYLISNAYIIGNMITVQVNDID